MNGLEKETKTFLLRKMANECKQPGFIEKEIVFKLWLSSFFLSTFSKRTRKKDELLEGKKTILM